MPIPKTPRTVFEKNPLAEVGCQIVVPTLLRLENNAPYELQEAIEDRYPNYDRGYFQADDRSEHSTVHEFISEDQFWKFSVCSEFVKLSTTDYRDRNQFRKRLEPLLEDFAAVYGRNQARGTSLFYRDVIDRNDFGLEGAAWSELLEAEFVGELAEKEILEREVLEMQRTITLKLSDAPGEARVDYGLHQLDEDHRVFVMDCYLNDNRSATFKECLERLTDYHDAGGNIFRWAITDRLFNVLKGENDD